jgi:hypothetical protein
LNPAVRAATVVADLPPWGVLIKAHGTGQNGAEDESWISAESGRVVHKWIFGIFRSTGFD